MAGRDVKTTALFNLPNAITVLRVVAVAPVMFLLAQGTSEALWAALGLMILSEITDGLDGYLARRLKQESAIGKILDPMADSLYRIAVFTAFTANHWMPVWMFLIMVWRDVGVSYIRVIAEQSVGTLGARASGKWKAVVQGAAQLSVVAIYAWSGEAVSPQLEQIGYGALALATAVTAYSLVDYAVSTFRRMG